MDSAKDSAASEAYISSLEDSTFMARVAEQAERFDDMAKYLN